MLELKSCTRDLRNMEPWNLPWCEIYIQNVCKGWLIIAKVHRLCLNQQYVRQCHYRINYWIALGCMHWMLVILQIWVEHQCLFTNRNKVRLWQRLSQPMFLWHVALYIVTRRNYNFKCGLAKPLLSLGSDELSTINYLYGSVHLSMLETQWCFR